MVSPRGTYLVVADALRTDLQAASEESALPSEAELMRRHGVSRTTVRRALRSLAEEGIVVSVPGKGWLYRGGAHITVQPLVERVQDVISADGLGPGDLFPSESKLSARLGVSRGAVRQALAQLEGRGVLRAVHGRGRFVQAPEGAAEGKGA